MGNGASMCSCCPFSKQQRTDRSPAFDDLDLAGGSELALTSRGGNPKLTDNLGAGGTPHASSGSMPGQSSSGYVTPSVTGAPAGKTSRGYLRIDGTELPRADNVVVHAAPPPRRDRGGLGDIGSNRLEREWSGSVGAASSVFSPREGMSGPAQYYTEGHSLESDPRPPAPVVSEKLIFANTAQMRSVQTLIELRTKQPGSDHSSQPQQQQQQQQTTAPTASNRGRRHRSFRWRLVYTSNVHGFTFADLQQRVKRVAQAYFTSTPSSVDLTGDSAQREEREGRGPAPPESSPGAPLGSTPVPVPTLLLLETKEVVWMRHPPPAEERASVNDADVDRRSQKAAAAPSCFLVDAGEEETAGRLLDMKPYHVCVGLYLASIPPMHVKQYYNRSEGFMFSFCVPVRAKPRAQPSPPAAAAATTSTRQEVVLANDAIHVQPTASPESEHDLAASAGSPPHVPATRTHRTVSPAAVDARLSPSGIYAASSVDSMSQQYSNAADFPLTAGDVDPQTEERCRRTRSRGPAALPEWQRSPTTPLSRSGFGPTAGFGARSRSPSQGYLHQHPPQQQPNPTARSRDLDNVFGSSLTSVSETTAPTMPTGVLNGPHAAAGSYGVSEGRSRASQQQPHMYHQRTISSGALSALSGTLVSVSSTDNDNLSDSISAWGALSTSSSSASSRRRNGADAVGSAVNERPPKRSLSANSSSSLLSSSSSSSSSSNGSSSGSSASTRRSLPPPLGFLGRNASHGAHAAKRHPRREGSAGAADSAGEKGLAADRSHDRQRRPMLCFSEKQLQRVNPVFAKPKKGPTRRRPKKLCVLVCEEGTVLVWLGNINKQPALILTNDLTKLVCHTPLPLVGDKRTVRKFLRYVEKQRETNDGSSGSDEGLGHGAGLFGAFSRAGAPSPSTKNNVIAAGVGVVPHPSPPPPLGPLGSSHAAAAAAGSRNPTPPGGPLLSPLPDERAESVGSGGRATSSSGWTEGTLTTQAKTVGRRFKFIDELFSSGSRRTRSARGREGKPETASASHSGSKTNSKEGKAKHKDSTVASRRSTAETHKSKKFDFSGEVVKMQVCTTDALL